MKNQSQNFANPNGHRGLGSKLRGYVNLAPALQNPQLRERAQRKAGEELFMKNWMTLRGLPVCITVGLLAVAGSSCGGGAVSYGASAAGTSSTSTTPTTTTTTTSTTSDSSTAPYNFSFSVTGAGGSNPTYTTGSTLIDTDNLLQVQVTAGAASEAAVPGTSFTADYNCVSYTVSVYDQNGNLLSSQATGTLSVNGPNYSGLCPNAQTSVTLNFNDAVSNGTHGGVQIGVVADQYDFYCQLWWAYYYDGNTQFYDDYSYMCPMKGVYSAHTVTGTLAVQTNGSSLD